ncbi:hypothetical protein A4H97_10610 [Niastella yeongjuensis]|uniref:GLUG domain-containing protein n=1 Tax=Niastella yeongjuensis TaxID=354355 RepID=A0A1V9EFV0_9BACT|nr:hypothetical protein [Niastella yeongjuensis]OQP44805.1 hypothetical protein A4H97_10610 [Niastella yeongjuensis]SEP42283.1 hypothetical protein SAMN05660816_05975 [Niastella yeongjuensis]
MRIAYLCALGLLLATFACKKNGSTDDVITDPPNTPQSTATFTLSRYGTADLVKLFLSGGNETLATIKDATGNTSFTWEIAGSNGMKKTTDTLVKGTGKTDNGGNATINPYSLYNYKDGTLTINIRFNNATATTISGTTKKEEFIIRSYRDLMAINNFTGNNLKDTFVQTQDIAFPDTVFSTAPVKYPLAANYDGRGYKVTNLTILTPARGANSPLDYVGLFSYIDDEVIVKNVRLELSAAGIKTTSPGICGGIAGSNWGNIINCSARGSIKSAAGFWSEVGGIAGETNYGRIIGCSFNGTLEADEVGGITAAIYFSHLNMCYSNYSVVANYGGGITGFIVENQNGISNDTVYNCYAYVKQAAITNRFNAVFYTVDPATVNCLYDDCYSNYGVAQPNAISYNTAQLLSSMIVSLQVSNLPAGIAPPPAYRPFKSSTDPNQPPLLWWE